jgi:hypothetical protein
MKLELASLYYDPKTQQFLLINEAHGGGFLGMYWGAGNGAPALPLNEMRQGIIADVELYPTQLNPHVDAMQSEHEWTEWETGEKIILCLLEVNDFAIEIHRLAATITAF